MWALSPKQLQKLFSLVDELEQTPVKERFSGRKYTVQVLPGSLNFLNMNVFNGVFFLGDHLQKADCKTHFTQAEIDELKQRDDIAIAWDKAKIEPVEESNDEK